MLFLSYGFCGADHSADTTPSHIQDIKKVEIMNCIVDTFYISKNISNREHTLIPEKRAWDFDTILHAEFTGNLLAGNIDFTADQVDDIRLKRREKDTYNWLTLDNIPIHTNSDLRFERTDRFAKGNTFYEYALIPIMSGNVEGNYNINTVKSTFSAIWFMEKEIAYPAELNIDISTEHIFTTSLVTTLGRKFPFVNRYGISNYEKGTINATFIPYNDTICSYDFSNAVRYREEVSKFLTNGSTKIIKHWDGRIWLASITDSIPLTENGHHKNPVQGITFVSVGEPDHVADLYDANLIDIDVERSVF